MKPKILKAEPSSSNNYCLRSATKRFKEESSQSHIGSSNENDPSEMDDPENSSISAATVALDNHLVLQEIFKYFSPRDLRMCCEVSEKWQAIAGPMIFEYHLDVDFSFSEINGITVKISKGYINPEIEERNFLPEGETEYLETLNRKNCFLSLEFRGDPNEHYERMRIHYPHCMWMDPVFHVVRDFVRKFKTRVYMIKCSHYSDMRNFFHGPLARDGLQRLPDFPNCEEYHEGSMCTLLSRSDEIIPSLMTNLRRYFLGDFIQPYCLKDFQTETPKALQTIPNLQEIHNVPFTRIGIMERAKKLHLVRSIRFHRVADVNLELDALKTMVQLGIKFKFLRIQRPDDDYYGSCKKIKDLKKQTNPQFKDLLKIGKDTLEHLVIHENNYGPLIDIPARMSALTHITLNTHHQYQQKRLHFPKGFNFSEFFPKLTTISFRSMSIAQWKSGGSWWNSKEDPGWDEFRKGIRNLRCEGQLSSKNEKYLLQRFPSVNCIEYVNIDDIYVDGIIAY